MAAMNKSLARSNKSPHGGQSDKEVARQWLLGRIHNEVEDLSPKLIRKGVGRRRAVNFNRLPMQDSGNCCPIQGLAKMRLFSIALAALALVTCHTPLRLAEAQVLTEFPNEYRGTWCETSATIGAESATPQYYYRCRREADAMMQIEATWFGSDRYTECLPIHAIKTNHGDLMIQAVCRNHIAERPNLFDQRWRLEQGGRRLRVTTPDNGVPLPDQMLGLDPRGWQPQ